MRLELIDVVSLAGLKFVITFCKCRAYSKFSVKTFRFRDSVSATIVAYLYLIRHGWVDVISVKAV